MHRTTFLKSLIAAVVTPRLLGRLVTEPEVPSGYARQAVRTVATDGEMDVVFPDPPAELQYSDDEGFTWHELTPDTQFSNGKTFWVHAVWIRP